MESLHDCVHRNGMSSGSIHGMFGNPGEVADEAPIV